MFKNIILNRIKLYPLLFVLISACSQQKSVQSSQESIASDIADAEGKPSLTSELQRDENRAHTATANATGPQGPQVLLGSSATGLKLKTIPNQATDGNGLLVAIDTPYQIFSKQGSYIHVAAWHTDGTPAQDADVFVGDDHMGKTNASGSFVFQYPPKGSNQRSMTGNTVRVVDAKERTLQGSVPFNPNLRTESFASDHVFVYADRGVYKPGDTIKVRMIGWHLKDDYQPLEEKEIEVLLKTSSGKVLGGAKRTTDEYGIASLDIPVPLTAKDGLYELHVSYQQERQTARLQIRDFKPPHIQIEHDLKRFITQAQSSFHTKIALSPSQGGEFKSGTITLLASTEDDVQILSRSQKIKGNGPHHFELSQQDLNTIKNSLQPGSWLKIKLETKEDATNIKDSVVREMRYTINPYVAVIELDKDQYTTDDPVELVAKIKDLDGVPLRNQNITVTLNGQSYTATTSEQGTAQFSLTMPERAANVELFIDGVKKPITRTHLNWVQPRPMVSHIADPIIKEMKKAHVTVKFPIDVIPVEDVVHMDVVDTSGAIVNAVLLPIKELPGGGYEASGDFNSPSWGSMLLTFFSLGKRKSSGPANTTAPHHQIGLMTEGQNLVVHPDRELTIVLDGIPDHAAPGSDVNVIAKILDRDGITTDASVGIAVTDQRILAMKDPLEITPMDHFYEPTLRTMSTTGSKILSWPVVSRNWGNRQMDIALPPFPFLEGGSISGSSFGAVGGEAEEELSMATSDEGDGSGSIDGISSSSGSSKSYKKYKKKMKPSKPSMPHASKEMAQGAGGLSSSNTPTTATRGITRAKQPQPRKTTITVRTRFPETSTWHPHTRTNGTLKQTISLPETIANQELILVASTKRGAVGIARKTIHVSQKLFIQTQFPRALYLGESVDVPVLIQNNLDKPQQASLRFDSDNLNATLEEGTFTIPANSSEIKLIRITPQAAGDLTYTLQVAGKSHNDAKKGTVRVHAQGTQKLTSHTGEIRAKSAYKHTFKVDKTSAQTAAWLSITPPTITTAMSALTAMEDTLQERPLTIASDLASASLILRYAQKNNIDTPHIADLRARVLEAIGALQFAQNPDGSFGYWRNGEPSAYITAWALEGLLEALELDLPVPQSAILNAGNFLAKQRLEDGLVKVDEIAFWEGDSAQVRLGITAEIFDIVSRIPTHMQSNKQRYFLNNTAPRLKKELLRDDIDPLTAARAIQGLVRHENLTQKEAITLVKNLQRTRDKNHWEPSWFHAYSGRIEATTAMISLMSQLDPQGFAIDIRDALNWVLSTREAWGQWHNERGTTAALRALLIANPQHQTTDGVLTITLDGKTIRQLKLSAKDPFMSAPELQHISLGQALPPGQHTVEVSFDGAMQIPVKLFTQTTQNTPSTSSASAHGYSIKASAPSTLTQGQDATLTLAMTTPKTHGPLAIAIANNGLLEIDAPAMQQLVDDNEDIYAWSLSEHQILLELSPLMSKTNIKLPFKVTRTGQGVWPSVTLFDTRAPDKNITVSAGKTRTK